MGFFSAIKIHLASLLLILQNRELFKWYLRLVVLTLFSAGVLLGLFWGFGGWGIWTLLGGDIWAGVAVFFWVIALFFISGVIVSSLLSLFVSVFTSERGMRITLGLLSGNLVMTGKSLLPLKRYKWQEFKSVLLSLGVGLTGWPLLVIPFLIPIGICVFGYCLGRETYDSALRVLREENMETPMELGKRPNTMFFVYLGLPAAILSMFPVVGWIFLPTLRVAGVIAAKEALSSRP